MTPLLKALSKATFQLENPFFYSPALRDAGSEIPLSSVTTMAGAGLAASVSHFTHRVLCIPTTVVILMHNHIAIAHCYTKRPLLKSTIAVMTWKQGSR